MKMNKKRMFKKIDSIIVTDIDGKVSHFSSVSEAANALEVTRAYVYIALRKGLKIRGCSVEAMYQLDDDEAYFAK